MMRTTEYSVVRVFNCVNIITWAGHVERMADDRLPKRAAELREQGRRRGRPRLRWEDCVKRDVERRETGRRRQETEEGGEE